MRVALLADVHANLAALSAVLQDLQSRSVDSSVCLGDLVGYNSQPSACISKLRASCDVIVAGNHDLACLRREALAGSSATTQHVQAWTASQLNHEELSFLRELPNIHQDSRGFVAVHGCYLNDQYYYGYVTDTMLDENLSAVERKMGRQTIALCGHTHSQMCAWHSDGQLTQRDIVHGAPGDVDIWLGELPRDFDSMLINPGSVGQPRDGDPRAAYGILDFDTQRLELLRVPYDVLATCEANQRAGFPEQLSERLRSGR